MIFRILQTWPVFVLEDSPSRIMWFKQRMPQAMFATTASAALRILHDNEFKVAFLDHDLGFLDAAYPERLHHNGKEVARYLAIKKFPGIVVIHSLNELGAEAMKRHLPQSHIAPYGTFDIVER